jgi:hypothetical protein
MATSMPRDIQLLFPKLVLAVVECRLGEEYLFNLAPDVSDLENRQALRAVMFEDDESDGYLLTTCAI